MGLNKKWLAYDTAQWGLLHPKCFYELGDKRMAETGRKSFGVQGEPFLDTYKNRYKLRGLMCCHCSKSIIP